MDLRTRFPRSMRVTLEGYVHLARMIDKCRAVLAGTEGEYIYPCPMDDRLLDVCRPDSRAIHRGSDEQSNRRWFPAVVPPHRQAPQPGRLGRVESQMMLGRGPTTPEKHASFNIYRDAVDPSRTDLTSWCRPPRPRRRSDRATKSLAVDGETEVVQALLACRVFTTPLCNHHRGGVTGKHFLDKNDICAACTPGAD